MAKVIFSDQFPMSSGYGEFPPKLTALTFFDPKFANSKEIIELLNCFDTFSGAHLDIFIKGCTSSPPEGVDESAVTEISLGSTKHYYSAQTLLKDVKELQQETSWRFSMEIDVILVSRQRWYNKFESGIRSDYKNSIVLNLYRMMNDSKISSYASFFSELIHFAEDYSGENPVWDMSDAKLWNELKKSLFESFKKYIGFRKFQMKVEDYAIQNIGKNA